MYFAIDIGVANVGYAVGDESKLVTCGYLKTEAAGDLEERKALVLDTLYGYFNMWKPELVIIEAFRVYAKKKALHKTAELAGALKEGLRLKNIRYIELPYRTWSTRYKKLDFSKIPDSYLEFVNARNEHVRDAVRMLISFLFSIKNSFRR